MPDRIIKESICTSDTLNKLTDFEERFWHRLTVNCDDYGRFDARPAILRGRLFPLRGGCTDRNMEEALNKLASVGLVALYEVDGKPYLQLSTWGKHQRIRAKRSKYPEPVGACCHLPSSDDECPRNPIQSESNPMRESESDATCVGDAALAAVMTAYMDRIDPTPSPSSMDELKNYVASMGQECCLRAIDIALDNKAAKWSYIRGVLRAKLSQGVKCIADWDALEAKREEQKPPPKNGPQMGTQDPKRVAEDVDWMKQFLAKKDGGDCG